MTTEAKEATKSSSSERGKEEQKASRNSKRNRSDAAPKSVQYYKPSGSIDAAQSLLERDDLTEQDVSDFCRTGMLSPHSEQENKEEVVDDAVSTEEISPRAQPQKATNQKDKDEFQSPIIEAYHARRLEIRDLAWKLWQGEAFVDDFGRLLPIAASATTTDEPQFPPPLGPLPGHHDNNEQQRGVGDAPFDNGNNNNNIHNILNNNDNNFNNLPFPLDAEEEERQWAEQEEREATAAIARAVQRYQQQGVPTEDYVLIRVPPMERPERASLTFRRICFAVLAVVTAFLCIMLQTLPLFPRESQIDLVFDKLLYELLNVRPFEDHVMECPGLHRSPPATVSSWQLPFGKKSTTGSDTDCSQGVLHVPSKTVLVDSYFKSSTHKNGALWEPHVLGLNVSWFLHCNLPETSCQSSSLANDNETELQGGSSCDIQSQPSNKDPGVQPRCFRGIHDNSVSDQEVGETLRLGSQLINEGWDHFDIHFDKILLLQERLPTLLQTIRSLLQETYAVRGGGLQPVAFRVSAVGALNGNGVAMQGSKGQTSNYLLRILNSKRYLQWIEKHKRRNKLARYSLAWPTRQKPFRDPCHLMADLEADPRFAILTTVFLSNGAGADFRGGASLYADDHPSNSNPRRKLQKGVTIDGSRGRLVVSTGGYENRRCRLPTRKGIRAALQIWWCVDTDGSEHGSCRSREE